MPKYTRNTGKEWSKKDETDLKKLAQQNTPTRVIGLKLGRTENSGAVESQQQRYFTEAGETDRRITEERHKRIRSMLLEARPVKCRAFFIDLSLVIGLYLRFTG